MKIQVKMVDEINNQRKLIENQKNLINYYETMSYSLGGIDYSKEPIDCSRNLEAPFVKWVYKKIEAEEVLKQLEKELKDTLAIFSLELESLEEPDYRKVLSYRYVLNKSWNEIGKIMFLSRASLYRLQENALNELNEKLRHAETQ